MRFTQARPRRVADVDADLETQRVALAVAAERGDIEAAADLIARIDQLLDERNQLLPRQRRASED